MSTVQLMSSSELFEFFKETWRLHHVEWSEPKAQAVLTAWQSRFALEVSQLTMDDDANSQFNFYSFTPSGLDSVVESASHFSWTWGLVRVMGTNCWNDNPLLWVLITVINALFLGVVITSAIVGVVFGTNNNRSDSGPPVSLKIRTGLALCGSIVALMGTAAGGGVACFLKIPFNVVSGKNQSRQFLLNA